MATFSFRALQADGHPIAGEIEAANAGAAIGRLQDRGLIPIEAVPLRTRRQAAGPGLGASRLAPAVTEFTRELATLLAAGQDLAGALELLAIGTENRRLAGVLDRVHDAVQGGRSLSEAMAAEPQAFDRLYVGMIRAGEGSGRLAASLQELALMRERSEALQRKVTSSLIYPVILLIASTGALVFLLTYVVPQFELLFRGTDIELPRITRLVLAISQNLRSYGIWALVLLLALLLLFRQLERGTGLLRLQRWLLDLPWLGRLVRERATAQFTRGLGTMLAGGMDLPGALALTRDMLANRAAGAALEEVILGVQEGRRLARCLDEADILAPTAVTMLEVGEESGRLAEVSLHMANAFEEKVGARLTRMVALVEPIMVLIMGLLVGGIVLAILNAVLSVNELAL